MVCWGGRLAALPVLGYVFSAEGFVDPVLFFIAVVGAALGGGAVVVGGAGRFVFGDFFLFGEAMLFHDLRFWA